jgi:hypothetical protein
MANESAAPVEPMSQPEDQLAQIPEAQFLAAWKALVGEPPAAMLKSRSEMIRVLVDSIPTALAADASGVVQGTSPVSPQAAKAVTSSVKPSSEPVPAMRARSP